MIAATVATIADSEGTAAMVIRQAFDALERPADRNLLRLRHGGQASLHGLARMFGTTEDTVTRWIAALREQLLDDARFRLAERLVAAGEHDVDGAIRAARAALDEALDAVLAAD